MQRYKITRHSTTAVVHLRRDGVLHVEIRGALTEPALLYLKAQITERSGHQLRSFVADYSRAAVAVSGAQLDAVLDGRDDQPAAMPAAMVVSEGDVQLFAGHSARLALRGVVRQVFTDSVRAIDWARRYAEAQG